MVLNFTPAPRPDYRIAVPGPGIYLELFNSDAASYQGSGMDNSEALESEAVPFKGRDHSLCLTLAPLAGIVLKLKP